MAAKVRAKQVSKRRRTGSSKAKPSVVQRLMATVVRFPTALWTTLAPRFRQFAPPQSAPSHRSSSGSSRARRTKSRVQPLPLAATPQPPWLQGLLKLQRISWLGMLGMCSLSLGVYGWSISSQQFWGQEYHRLEQLRRDERQLVAGTEMLKNNIAQQANAKPDGLVPQGSDNVVFLSPAPDRPLPTVRQSSSPASPPPDARTPLGY